jgi:hypothetical protein
MSQETIEFVINNNMVIIPNPPYSLDLEPPVISLCFPNWKCNWRDNVLKQCLTLCFRRLFFHFRGGQPLHNVQSFTSHSLTENLTTRFVTSILRVCLMVSLNVLSLPRHCYDLTPSFFYLLLLPGPICSLFSTISPLWLWPSCSAGRHDGSSVFGRGPIYSGTHQRPGCVSLAVGGTQRLDGSVHIGPPVLW